MSKRKDIKLSYINGIMHEPQCLGLQINASHFSEQCTIWRDIGRCIEREREGTPLDAEFNNVDSSKPWQNHLWSLKCYLLQIPVGSAFLIIQGCSVIFWRESLFEESFTRSCTYFQITVSRMQLYLSNDSITLHPDINMKTAMTKHTRRMRSLASVETQGVEGKLRSTFIILVHPNTIYQTKNNTTYGIIFFQSNHTKILKRLSLPYLLNVSLWLSASNGGTP